MYNIKAKVEFSGVAWGLQFVNGVDETKNEYLAKKLKKKGYVVTKVEKVSGKKSKEPENVHATEDEDKEKAY